MGLFFLSLMPVAGAIFEVVDNASLLLAGDIPGLLLNLIDPLNTASRMTRGVRRIASTALDNLSEAARQQYQDMVNRINAASRAIDQLAGEVATTATTARRVVTEDGEMILAPAGANIWGNSSNSTNMNTGGYEVRVVRMDANNPNPGNNRRYILDHEAAGGHTHERHVGKERPWLHGRLQREQRLKAASSFSSIETANIAQGAFAKRYGDEILDWLENSDSGKFVREFDTGRIIGEVLPRGGDLVPTSRVTVVLYRISNPPYWYYRTSYPSL